MLFSKGYFNEHLIPNLAIIYFQHFEDFFPLSFDFFHFFCEASCPSSSNIFFFCLWFSAVFTWSGFCIYPSCGFIGHLDILLSEVEISQLTSLQMMLLSYSSHLPYVRLFFHIPNTSYAVDSVFQFSPLFPFWRFHTDLSISSFILFSALSNVQLSQLIESLHSVLHFPLWFLLMESTLVVQLSIFHLSS